MKKKRVKIITGTGDKVSKEAAKFEEEHEIIDIIQKNENVMIMFYMEEEENEGRTS